MTTILKQVVQPATVVRNFMEAHMERYPFIFSNEWRYRIRRHLAFWTFWWLFQGFLYSFLAAYSTTAYLRRLPASMLESLIFLLGHIFLAYCLMYIVIPKFLLRQKYWQTAVLTVLCFFATAAISSVLGIFVIDKLRALTIGPLYSDGPFRKVSLNIHMSLLAGLRGGLTVGGIAAAIKLMKHWYTKEQRNLQLQKENIESQLQLLKAQIHPHFLFNTLNNIYSYTQNTSLPASRLVSGLSDLLRYMLYECNQTQVPLSKELKMVRDYISLEKIRYGNKLDIHLDLPDKTNDLYIAPLLLLPLVENCFKHGTSNMLDQPWISLQLILQGRQVHMKLVNGKVRETKTEIHDNGIGITNVKKRLDILYPNRYELTINNDDEVFIVNLKILLEQVKDLTVVPSKIQEEVADA